MYVHLLQTLKEASQKAQTNFKTSLTGYPPPHDKHTPTHTSEALHSLKRVLFWRVSLGVAVVACVLAEMTEQHKAGLLSALQSVFNPSR